MFTVIPFDIVDDRARYRVVRALRKYAVRVQKSVFEAPDLSPQELARLRSELEKLIDPSVDTVRYYRLCESCVARVEISGQGRVVVAEDYKII